MTAPVLSFVVPFHRRIDLLAQAVRSVLDQSDPRWCLVVVDDNPVDQGAAALVRSLDDPRITYRRNPRPAGMSANWNCAVDSAATALVTVLHADDILEPGYAATMIAAHAGWPDAGAIFCAARAIGRDGAYAWSAREFVKRRLVPSRTRPFVLAGEDGLRALLRGNFIVCPTLCYRRAVFDKLRFDPAQRWVPDLDMTIRMLLAGTRLVGLPDTLYRYRRHGDQATRSADLDMRRLAEEKALWRRTADDCARAGWNSAAKRAGAMGFLVAHALWLACEDLAALRIAGAVAKLRFLAALRAG